MGTETTGIAVWGIGKHAQKTVLPAISQCNSLKLIGLGTRNAEVREQQAALYQCQAWDRLEDILDCPAVDVVFLATPIGLHHRDGLKVLHSGRHLWSEKALTTSLADAENLFETASANDLSFCVVCAPLHHQQYGKIRTMIDQNAIGKIRSLMGTFEFPHMSTNNIRYRADLGGSAILDLGFYPIIVLSALMDDDVTPVSAKFERLDGYSIDTGGDAVLETGCGAEIRACWGYGRQYRNEITITGEHGSLHVSPAFSKPDGQDLSIRLQIDEVTNFVSVSSQNQFVSMLDSFHLTIENREQRQRQRKWALNTQNLIDKVTVCAANSGIR